jgi:hypothetical protein
MMITALEAKAKLEAEGLHVSCNNAHSLWIAATLRDAGEEIKLSEDACSLIWDSGRWVAVFPAEGLRTYEVPGTLSELVALITAVYDHYRQAGGPLKQAFRQVVSGSEQYLAGRPMARV